MAIFNQLVFSTIVVTQSVKSPTQHFTVTSELIVSQTLKVNPQILLANNILHIIQETNSSDGDLEHTIGNTLNISQTLYSPKEVRSVLGFSYSVTYEKAKWVNNTLVLNQTLVVSKGQQITPSTLLVRQVATIGGVKNKTIDSALTIGQHAEISIRKINRRLRQLNPC